MKKLDPDQVADLQRLHERLRLHERDLLLSAAKGEGIPPRRAIQELAEIGAVIVAVGEALIEGA